MIRLSANLWNKTITFKNASIVGTSILVVFGFCTGIVGTISAETGSGTDIFKVILTILGADKANSGDVVAIVTVDDHSKVKLFQAKGNDLLESSNTSSSSVSGGQGQLIEYVATFPNVTVNSGETYHACALPLKTLKILCEAGNNSPASRPEVVDINLGSATPDAKGDDASTTVDSETNQSLMAPSDNEDD